MLFTDIFPEANNLFPSTSRTNNYNIPGSILENTVLIHFFMTETMYSNTTKRKTNTKP